MRTTQGFRLLLLAGSLVSAAEAGLKESIEERWAAVAERNNMMGRDDTDLGGLGVSLLPLPDPIITATDDDSSSSSTTSSESSSSTSKSSSTSSEESSTTESSSSTSSTPSSTSSSSSEASKTAESTTSSAAKVTSSAKATEAVTTEVQVVTKTSANGQQYVETTTSTSTPTAALSTAGSGGSSGMSAKTRNTIVGVAVGVGGAAILAALGIVGWRIWGRKKNYEEAAGLMEYHGDLNVPEKPDRGSSGGNGRSPFQSTLENYHQPGGVTASSNF